MGAPDLVSFMSKALYLVLWLSLPPMPADGVDDLVAVYLPMSYTVGGYTLFVHRHDIEPIGLSVEAAMRLVLMGGVQGAAPSSSAP